MTTALDIITGAARLLGVVRKGEALDGDEAYDGLNALNDMLASWGAETLIGLARIRESFTLTGAASYTIGTGQDFDTANPIEISNAFVRSGGVDYPLEIISDEQYDNITVKDITGLPCYLCYTASPTADTGTIKLYPAPAAGYELHLLSEKPMAALTLASDLFFPQVAGKRAARYNLAIEMAPEFQVEPSSAVVAIARQSLAQMKLEGAKSRKMARSGVEQYRNVYTGWAT